MILSKGEMDNLEINPAIVPETKVLKVIITYLETIEDDFDNNFLLFFSIATMIIIFISDNFK